MFDQEAKATKATGKAGASSNTVEEADTPTEAKRSGETSKLQLLLNFPLYTPTLAAIQELLACLKLYMCIPSYSH